MDDREIRAYIGQEDPLNDDNTAVASDFSMMRDQSKWNNDHSNSNREYTIMKNYKARWFFQWGSPMPESTTTSVLSSYVMDNYDGGVVSSGEGELNWRGNAKCGGQGAAGVNCYSTRTGSPSANPNGGHGKSV